MAKKTRSRKPQLSEWTDKDEMLDYWLQTDGRPDFEKAKSRLPNPTVKTLRSWASSFNKGGRGAGYPTSGRKRVDEIVAVLRKLGANAVDIEWAKAIEDESVPLQRRSNEAVKSRKTPEKGVAQSQVKKRLAKPRREHIAPKQYFSDELPEDQVFFEGGVSKVFVNRYERKPDARFACLNKLGYHCDVCNMNFLERYGEIGNAYIHVHHRNPLSLRKSEYQVDPVKDLIPVCPNCHAMLHYGRPWDSPRSTHELRKIMKVESRNSTRKA